MYQRHRCARPTRLIWAISGAFALFLHPAVAAAQRVFPFDFPGLEIGVADNEAGPTGVTVFHFTRPVEGAIDVRGGAPGSMNTDALRAVADDRALDAVVFAGGSSYGLEAAAGVQDALGARTDGFNWTNIPFVVGSIIYDLGYRRFNAVTPDAALGRTALAEAKPGAFPLGAVGAGRFANTGGYFGRSTYSGQGAGMRQSGPTKVLVFSVVNAFGAIVDRGGNVARCPGPSPDNCGLIKDWIANYIGRLPAAAPKAAARALTHNTTITLVVTNQKLPYWQLQRLAIQVHTSMARAIQPFSTADDGDTLYAVTDSTVENPALSSEDLGTLASEAAWDAVLSSRPDVDPAPEQGPPLNAAQMQSVVGRYGLGPDQIFNVGVDGGRLWVEGPAAPNPYLPSRKRTALEPINGSLFRIAGPRGDRIAFEISGGKVTRVIINPGHWPVQAVRID